MPLVILAFIVVNATFSRPVFDSNGIKLSSGWQPPLDAGIDPGASQCDRPLNDKGFPVAKQRPAEVFNCYDDTNSTAGTLDFLVQALLAAGISLGLVRIASHLRKRSFA